jgi:hypothetical protein
VTLYIFHEQKSPGFPPEPALVFIGGGNDNYFCKPTKSSPPSYEITIDTYGYIIKRRDHENITENIRSVLHRKYF